MAYNVTAQLNLQLNQQSIAQITQALNSITNGKSIGGNLFNTSGIRSVTNELNNSKNAMMQFGEQAGLAAKRFGAFTLTAGSLVQVTQGFRTMLSEAIAFDREMVKLKQVSNETAGGGVAAIREEIDRLSTGLGVSSNQLARVSVVLKQANLNLGETKTALEALALSALAPNFDSMEKTAEGAIAVLKQFKIPVEELKSALGSINAVAGEFAVEASDLIGVIQRTGGAFKAAGGNLNELLALFTSVRQTTRESAESIATGLRTIFTRIQRTGTADALREVGVNLRYTRDEALALGNVNLTSQFVGAYEAVRRLSIALNQIPATDPKFAQLVEELGGYRQISKVIPLIQEFSVSQQALNVAITGGSSLMNSAAAAQGSFGNRLDKLKESYLQFGRALLDSSSFKTLFTAFETGAQAALALMNALKPLLPMLTVLATMKMAQGVGSFGAGFFQGLMPTKKSGGGPLRFKKGGIVPGSGSGDIVPAMLEPGEMVIPKRMVKKYSFGGAHTADIDEEALNNPSGFREYMKGSTTINPKTGKYRKFFHGTKGQNFDYFSNKHARSTWFGRGHYFSADAKVASRYSETDETPGGYDPGARVMSATLQMKNPYTWNSDKSLKDFIKKGGKDLKSINGQFDQKDWDAIVQKGVLPEDISQGTLDHLNKIFTKFPSIAKKWNTAGKKGMSPESKMKFIAHGATQTLKKQGYDSVNVDYGLGRDYFNASTVFNPNQIKSLGNEGGWDPSLKEIGKNSGGLIRKFGKGGVANLTEEFPSLKKYYDINKDLYDIKIVRKNSILKSRDYYRKKAEKLWEKASSIYNDGKGSLKEANNFLQQNKYDLMQNLGPKELKKGNVDESRLNKIAGALAELDFYKSTGQKAKKLDVFKGADFKLGNGRLVEIKTNKSFVDDNILEGKALLARANGTKKYKNGQKDIIKTPIDFYQAKASGGFIVPGVGDTDSVPMDLPVGSYVIKKSSTKKLGFANGGVVPALLTPGELVIDPKTASGIGQAKLDHMNRTGRSAFAKGGRIGFAGGGDAFPIPSTTIHTPGQNQSLSNLYKQLPRLYQYLIDDLTKINSSINETIPLETHRKNAVISIGGIYEKQLKMEIYHADLIKQGNEAEAKRIKGILDEGKQQTSELMSKSSKAIQRREIEHEGKIVPLKYAAHHSMESAFKNENPNAQFSPPIVQPAPPPKPLGPPPPKPSSPPPRPTTVPAPAPAPKQTGPAPAPQNPSGPVPTKPPIRPSSSSPSKLTAEDNKEINDWLLGNQPPTPPTPPKRPTPPGGPGGPGGPPPGGPSPGGLPRALSDNLLFEDLNPATQAMVERLARLSLVTGESTTYEEARGKAITSVTGTLDRLNAAQSRLVQLETEGQQGTAEYTKAKMHAAEVINQANQQYEQSKRPKTDDQNEQLAKIRSKGELQQAGIEPHSENSADISAKNIIVARNKAKIEEEYITTVMAQIKAAHPNLAADEQMILAKEMHAQAIKENTIAVNSSTGAIEGDTRLKAKGFDAPTLLAQQNAANQPKKQGMLGKAWSGIKDQWQNNPEMKSMAFGVGASYAAEALNASAGDPKEAYLSGDTQSYKNTKSLAGGLEGAAMGAQMGAVAGPLGAAIGAIGGGIIGAISAGFTANKDILASAAADSQEKLGAKLTKVLSDTSESRKIDISGLASDVRQNAMNAAASASADNGILESMGFGRSALDKKQDAFNASKEAKQKTAGQTTAIVTSELSKKMSSSMTGKESNADLYQLGNAAIAVSDGLEDLIEASRQVGESFSTARERILKEAASMAKMNMAKKAGIELEKTIDRSNTFLKTFADNLEGASIRVQKSFANFDSIMASLDTGSRQMQNYDLEKNVKVLSSPSSFSSQEYKSSIESSFSSFGPDLTSGLANQYAPMADISNKLPQIIASSVNDANPMESIERKLSDLMGGKDDPNVKAIINSITAKLGGKDNLKDIAGDGSKLAEEVMKPLMEPMTSHGTKIAQLILDNSNKLSAGFAKLNEATLKLVEGIEKADSLRLDQMQTMASAQSIASGASITGELGPNPQLQLNMAAMQQSRVLGMAGRPDLLGNTAGIGQALMDAQDRQRQIEQTPLKQGELPLEKAKAFAEAGNQVNMFKKALQDSIPNMQKVAAEYTKQANEMQKQRMAGMNLAKKLALGGKDAKQEYKAGEKVFNKLISGQITQEQVMKSPRLAKQLESFQQMHQGVDYRGMNVEDTINKMVYSGAAEQRGFGPTAKQEAAVRMQAAQAQGVAADAQDQLNAANAKGIIDAEQALIKSQDSLRVEIEKLTLQMQLDKEKLNEPTAEIKDKMKGNRELLDTIDKNKLTDKEKGLSEQFAPEIKAYREARDQEKTYQSAAEKGYTALEEAKDVGPKEHARVKKLLESKVDRDYAANSGNKQNTLMRKQIAETLDLDENEVDQMLHQASQGLGNKGKPTSLMQVLERKRDHAQQNMEKQVKSMGGEGLEVVKKEDAVAKAKSELESRGGEEKVKKETVKFETEQSERQKRIKEKEDRLEEIKNANAPPQELMGPPAPPAAKAKANALAVAENPAVNISTNAATSQAPTAKDAKAEKRENLIKEIEDGMHSSPPPNSNSKPRTPEEEAKIGQAFKEGMASVTSNPTISSKPQLQQQLDNFSKQNSSGGSLQANNAQMINQIYNATAAQNGFTQPTMPQEMMGPAAPSQANINLSEDQENMAIWKKSGGDPRYKPLPAAFTNQGDPRFRRLPASMTSGGDPRFRRVPQSLMPGKNQWKGPGADTTGIMGPPSPVPTNQNVAIMGPPSPPSVNPNGRLMTAPMPSNVMSNNAAAPQVNTNLNQSTSFNQTAASFTGFTASFDSSIANFNSAIENFGVKVGEFAAAVSVIPASLTVNGEVGANVTTNAAGIVTQISEAVNAMIAKQVVKSLPTPSMDEASKPS